MSEFSKTEIIWWKNVIRIENGKWIRDPNIYIYLETDALKAGWGTKLDGRSTDGMEIMAIKFLQILCQNVRNIHICIRSDNSAAVNNQG